MKRVLLALLLLFPVLVGAAQEKPDTTASLLKRMDTRMYNSQHRAGVDTNYIHIPEERWTLKTSSNISWNTLGVTHLEEDTGFATVLNSAPTYSQGFSVAWRWLELGVNINPAWFFPRLKNSDQAYSISLYGNKFCMSATFRYSNSYEGRMISYPDSTSTVLPRGDVNVDLTGDFDAWYVFNGDKCSFAAPFSMMQVQKRSAGSPVLGLSLRNGLTKFEGSSYQGSEVMSLMTNILAIGAGYAHNFVTAKNWLIHFSIMANMSVLSYNKWYTEKTQEIMKNTFPDWVGILQFSALHWKGKWFYGANFTIRGATYGTTSQLSFSNARTEGHLVLGCRL